MDILHGKYTVISKTISLTVWRYLLLTIVMGATAHVQFPFGAEVIIVVGNVSGTAPLGSWHYNAYTQNLGDTGYRQKNS